MPRCPAFIIVEQVLRGVKAFKCKTTIRNSAQVQPLKYDLIPRIVELENKSFFAKSIKKEPIRLGNP